MSRPATRLVLDASVATKWFLNDEEFVEEADKILQAYRDGRVELYAPDHIRYEVGNALRNAVRRGRIDEVQGRHSLSIFLSWQLLTVADDELLRVSYDLAIQYGCAFYDGLYLALAHETGFPLVHADARLRNSLAGRFAGEHWIESFIASEPF